VRLCAALLAVLLCAGCAGTGAGPDPWRATNERVFAFNETVDRYALEPMARAWDFALPDFAQRRIADFLDNLGRPITAVHDILQAKPLSAFRHVWGFAMNATLGIGGLFDVAGMAGLEHDREDFGQTLARWGVPGGPYVVMPFLGPSNFRDSNAIFADIFISPQFLIPDYPDAALLAQRGAGILNARAAALEEIAESRATSVDFYVFVREAWMQNRERQIRDGAPPPADDDFYDIDDLDDLDEEDLE